MVSDLLGLSLCEVCKCLITMLFYTPETNKTNLIKNRDNRKDKIIIQNYRAGPNKKLKFTVIFFVYLVNTVLSLFMFSPSCAFLGSRFISTNLFPLLDWNPTVKA